MEVIVLRRSPLTVPNPQPPPRPKHKKHFLAITLIFISIGALIFFLWLFIWRFAVSTEDAYVNGNQVIVTPKISGFITKVTVDDTQVVEQGRVLVELDQIDTKVALESAINKLAEQVRTVTGLFENVKTLEAEQKRKQAELAFALEEFKHRKNLVEGGGVSKEEFQRSETNFISTYASLIAIHHQLRASKALIANTTIATHPLVESAKDGVKMSWVNLQRCTIRSPVKGVVAMKNAQVGESIQPLSPLMMVAPLDQIWVDANYKETQLRKVRIGQPVRLYSDIYGHSVVYHGKVIGIAAATGSVLSVLPPQNATGNWIKIVQRLPVRVQLDPKELADYPLRLGLSMHVKIDIHNTTGKFFPLPHCGPDYTTPIFEGEEKGVEALIAEVIEKNMSYTQDDRKQT